MEGRVCFRRLSPDMLECFLQENLVLPTMVHAPHSSLEVSGYRP